MTTTDTLIRMFREKHTGTDSKLIRQAEIYDVLEACFPQESPVYLETLKSYPLKIHDVEARIRMYTIRYAGDNEGFNDAFATQDRIRSQYHNAAIDAAASLNSLCDKLNIDHLFSANISKQPGARTAIGEEIIRFADYIRKEGK